MDNAIEVADLGKRYRRRGMGAQTLFGRMSSLFRPVPGEEFWAVRNIAHWKKVKDQKSVTKDLNKAPVKS